MSDPIPAPRGHCETTQWSIVLRAGQADRGDGRVALKQLCETYWYPVYCYIRRRGREAEEARDLTQDFFLFVLDGPFLQSASPERGRFRGYLFQSVRNFLSAKWRRDTALKRGGGQTVLSLDDHQGEARFQAEPKAQETPETAFERNWALAVIERAVQRLAESYREAGRAVQFDKLHPYLAGRGDLPRYTQVADELGMDAGSVAVTIHRMRRRFAELLREEIARTVEDDAAIEEELRYLRRTLSGGASSDPESTGKC